MTDVKWKDENGVHYGTIRSDYNAEQQAAMKIGEIVVDDAIYPKSYQLKLSDVIKLKSYQEIIDYTTLVCTQHLLEASKLPTDKLVAGRLFVTPVADGVAYYIITKVSKINCNVEWRGFCPDRWVDRLFGYGGSFRIKDVSRFVGPPRKDVDYQQVYNDLNKKFKELYK